MPTRQTLGLLFPALLIAGVLGGCSDNNTAGERPLIPYPVYTSAPEWSPDGETILYRDRGSLAFPSGGIWAVTADGDSSWFVTTGGTPDWSPDGESFAFSRNRTIWVHDLRTGDERTLTPSMNAFFPAWKPSGDLIVFDVSTPAEMAGIWTVTPDGEDLNHLDTGELWAREPVWSPNGEAILFRASKNSVHNLYRLDVQSGSVDQLTSFGRSDSRPVSPTWSPDGQILAYGLYEIGIRLVDLSSGHEFTIPNTAIHDASKGPTFSFSPDGEYLVYNKQHLWITKRDGSENRLFKMGLEWDGSESGL